MAAGKKNHGQPPEDCLEAVFLLQRRVPRIRLTDLAAQRGYTKPSIGRAISILKKNGFSVSAHLHA